MANPDARRSRRTLLIALARVFDHSSRTMIGYLGDIATGGMMIHSHRQLPPPGSRVVTIHLPHPERGLVTIDAGVRVAWQHTEGYRPQYRVGCEFLAVDPTDHLLLLQAARSYGLA